MKFGGNMPIARPAGQRQELSRLKPVTTRSPATMAGLLVWGKLGSHCAVDLTKHAANPAP